MTTLLNANNVGDKYRDSTGSISTIVHIDADRMIVRRAGSGRFPSFSVFGPNRSSVIASGLRSMSEAMSA